MDLKVLKEIKNKRGELKTKVVRVANKDYRKGLKFNDINELYKELLEKYKAEDITITAKPLDGNFVTLKTTNFLGDNLKHADENYYSSLPKAVKDKLQGKYVTVDITIQC
jgi:hypothetical protein